MSQKLQHLEVDDSPHVRMVGWVPSVVPYLHRTRLTVVPLLHGAGTKHKVIQALMAGTPTVTSTIGVEGLGVEDEKHALVADDPLTFAAQVARLVQDEDLWLRLAHAGRAHVLARHGRQVVRELFDRSLAAVLDRKPKQLRLADLVAHADAPFDTSYAQLVRRIADTVRAELPAGARAAIVSKGDEALLTSDGISASHFPCTSDGAYVGYHPADSAAAIALLEAQRVAGIQFLVVPRTAFWWLEYYTAFRDHLERRYRLLFGQQDTCLIFDLHAEVPA